jgi:hypothetical protein
VNKKSIHRVPRYDADALYPSLDEHRASRRRFLAGSAPGDVMGGVPMEPSNH